MSIVASWFILLVLALVIYILFRHLTRRNTKPIDDSGVLRSTWLISALRQSGYTPKDYNWEKYR